MGLQWLRRVVAEEVKEVRANTYEKVVQKSKEGDKYRFLNFRPCVVVQVASNEKDFIALIIRYIVGATSPTNSSAPNTSTTDLWVQEVRRLHHALGVYLKPPVASSDTSKSMQLVFCLVDAIRRITYRCFNSSFVHSLVSLFFPPALYTQFSPQMSLAEVMVATRTIATTTSSSTRTTTTTTARTTTTRTTITTTKSLPTTLCTID